MGHHTKQQLQAEIQRCNQHLRVAEVYKFGVHTHVFKIEFTTTEMARTVLERGLLVFHMRITPSQIKQEENEDVLMCFKCYQLESHTTRECPSPNIVICSECSGPHNFKNCNETFKKCINCDGPHRTMAMSCPVKKEKIKNKRVTKEEEKKQKEATTYAGLVKKTVESVQQQHAERDISIALSTAGIRAYIMILDTHMTNMIKPGTYSTRLNQTLKNNEIEPINFGDEPDSVELFKSENIGKTLVSLLEIVKTNSMQESVETKKEEAKIFGRDGGRM